ncbi:hypothetical protein [Rubripirellula reticaptiva]|uniref:Uncharacterized protein n=1 Tax=Rubripirellula reticaptiva TaxID=2528013 RepID=A0A5C6ERA3_9BACT|nr:hypothetical protein [Rubripirellula reticaptiva]TWU51468.1 hypothetical protein Poly59_30600 [Rubripirellula reticaptiva]
MSNDHILRKKIRNYIIAEFGDDFNASIVVVQSIKDPIRFVGPVYLAVVSLRPLAEGVSTTLTDCDPDDIERMQRLLSDGDEVSCVFNNSGQEIERHFRGMDYFFDYQKIEM